MSELENLADNVRALAGKTPAHLRAVQEASQSLRSAVQLAASTPRGRQKLAGMLQSNGSSFQEMVTSIETFNAGASDFATRLVGE